MKNMSFIFWTFIYINLAYTQVGDKAIDFTLETLDHGELSLSDYKGKVIFIYFFYSF